MATPFCSSDQEREYQPSSSPLRLFWVSCMPAGGGLVSSPETLWVEVWWFSWPPEWCTGVSCECAAAGWLFAFLPCILWWEWSRRAKSMHHTPTRVSRPSDGEVGEDTEF
eukprot:RCo005816